MKNTIRASLAISALVVLVGSALAPVTNTASGAAIGECTINDIDFLNLPDDRPTIAQRTLSLNSSSSTYEIGLDYYARYGDDITYYVNSNATDPEGNVKLHEGDTLTFAVASKSAPDDVRPRVALVDWHLSDCDIVAEPLLIPSGQQAEFEVLSVIEISDNEFTVAVKVPEAQEIQVDFTKLVIFYEETEESRAFYIAPDPTETIADATNQATGQSMHSEGRTFYGEKFGSGAAVIGKVVDCATLELRKHGSPTDIAEIGFYDSNMSLVKQFGTLDVSTLATAYTAYEFCLPSADSGHLIEENQILAVTYNGGDPINRIDVRRSNVGAGPDYDGLAAYHVNYDGIWHIYNEEGNSRDLLFKLTHLD